MTRHRSHTVTATNDSGRRTFTAPASGVVAILAAAWSPMAPLTVPPPAAVVAPSAPPTVAETAVVEPALTPPAARRGERFAVFGRERVSDDVRAIADWVVDSGDNRGLPFILVDKKHAKVLVFDAKGRLRGASPALLGAATGDDSVPGIGDRKIADIRPEERTTPAGRFAAELGHNANGEDILWVDYDNAVSMHRVRAHDPKERRLQRLASATPADNRISYGCINLPAAFYDAYVKPAFAPQQGVVYVLPETRPAQALFGAYPVHRTARRELVEK